MLNTKRRCDCRQTPPPTRLMLIDQERYCFWCMETSAPVMRPEIRLGHRLSTARTYFGNGNWKVASWSTLDEQYTCTTWRIAGSKIANSTLFACSVNDQARIKTNTSVCYASTRQNHCAADAINVLTRKQSLPMDELTRHSRDHCLAAFDRDAYPLCLKLMMLRLIP